MTVIDLESYRAAVDAAADPPPREELPRAVCALDAPPFTPPQWLVQDLWPLGLLGLLVGDGGTFKSSLALHMAGAIAGGYPVFDRYATQRRAVLVVSAEDDLDTMAMRLEAFAIGHGWDRQRTLGNVHLVATAEPVLASLAWQRHIGQEVERLDPGFIVFDPWADMLGGDENANTDARPAIKYMRSLMSGGRSSVCVVHHMGKAGQDKRPLDRIRGASALPSASRVIYFLDWHDNAVHVENLKQSRAERLPTFVLDRTIRSATGNRAHWEVARVSTRDAADFRDSEAKRWVLLTVSAHPGTGSTELRRLRSVASGAPSNGDIQVAIRSLVGEGYLTQTAGKQNKLHLYVSPSGAQLVASLEPVGPRVVGATSDPETASNGAYPDPAQCDLGRVGQGLDDPLGDPAQPCPDPAQHAFREGPGSSVAPLPPLRGGKRDAHLRSAATWTEETDRRDELEERLGIQGDGL